MDIEIDGKMYMTEREFYDVFICTKADVTKWCSDGMPRIKQDGERYFNRADCHAWFSDNRTKKTIAKQTLKGFVTREELAKLFGVDARTINRIKKRGMPFTMRGKQAVYNAEECQAWYENEKSACANRRTSQ